MGEERSGLRLGALGGLTVERAGERIDTRIPAKAAALVIHLADVGGRVQRSTLAGLLWSDVTEEAARRNLRVALTRARAELGDAIRSDRAAIWLEPGFTYDVRALETTAELVDGVGEFLAGFHVPGAELFDDWVRARRATLRQLVVDHLLDGASDAARERRWDDCGRLARQVLELEPWHEEAHRHSLEATVVTAGRAAALARHDAFVDRLAAEFGVEPEPETDLLVESIRHRRVVEEAPVAASTSTSTPTTRLVGRGGELEEVETACGRGRPVVIVGPGGIGKSRLLAAYANRCRQRGDDVRWVSLQGVPPLTGDDAVRVFVEALLAELGEPVGADEAAVVTLERVLANRSLTLCVDNVEQFEGVEAPVAAITVGCPAVQLVLTSRRRLKLVSAIDVELGGLETDDASGLSVAAQLFFDRAQSELDPRHDALVVEQICRSLDGHPLAIELAAQWATTVPLDELVGGTLPDAPLDVQDLEDRHQSIDALVGASIARVSDSARTLLEAASTFAGSFSSSDLAALEPLEPAQLVQLTDYCLLSTDGQLYRLHPLIRSHLAATLRGSDRSSHLARLHAHRMVATLADLGEPGPRSSSFQRSAEDLHHAMRWWIANAGTDELLPPMRRYLGHLSAWGRAEEAEAMIADAMARPDLTKVMRAELHRHAADAMLDRGATEQAIGALERGLADVGSPIPLSSGRRRLWTARVAVGLPVARVRGLSGRAADRAAERARLMSSLGELYYVSDRRAEMISYALGAIAAGRVSRRPQLLAAGDAGLAIASQLAGRHRAASRYHARAKERLVESERTDYTTVETLGILGLVDASAGRFADARAYCDAAGEAGAALGRMRFVGQTEILRALVDHHDGLPGAALARLARVEALLERTGFRRGLTWVHGARAEVALQAGDLELASRSAADARLTADTAAGVVDRARAAIVRARVAVAEADLATARQLLDDAGPALGTNTALAFHLADAHRGAAAVATELELHGFGSDAANWARHLQKVTRSLPLLEAAQRPMSERRRRIADSAGSDPESWRHAGSPRSA